MNLRVGDVLEAIDRRAPFRTAALWDAVGLQIGAVDRPVSRGAVVHEITDETLSDPTLGNLDLLVTYHPLIFRALSSVTAVPGPEGRVLSLLERGVSVIAVHTNWDAAPDGTADSLAGALGIENAEGFATVDTAGGEPASVGRCGSFNGSAADLLDAVRNQLDSRPRTAGLGDRRLRRVAVLPGSGGSHLNDAISAGADVYVTGDISHHETRRGVEHGMAVVDAGHTPTERPGVRSLRSFVAGIVDGAADLVDVDDDPWGFG